jgi:hypothetical protein
MKEQQLGSVGDRELVLDTTGMGGPETWGLLPQEERRKKLDIEEEVELDDDDVLDYDVESSEVESSESSERHDSSDIFNVRRPDDLYKELKVLRLADTILLRSKRSSPNPNLLYGVPEKYNCFGVLSGLRAKPSAKGLRKEVRLNMLIERFFAELDKFVSIANHCLKSVDIADYNEEFDFALTWIRNAFHLLGIDAAKYYAYYSPGPYKDWNRDIKWLMNRYFFNPEFNNVNGFNLEEFNTEKYQFVETASGDFRLAYSPYPGYYHAVGEEKKFCSNCEMVLPPSFTTLSRRRLDKKERPGDGARAKQNVQ